MALGAYISQSPRQIQIWYFIFESFSSRLVLSRLISTHAQHYPLGNTCAFALSPGYEPGMRQL